MLSGMLNEVRVESFSYDAASDTARIKAPGASGSGRRALLDEDGFLVGVDLRGDDGRGSVVMVGPHEAVSGAREIAMTIDGDGIVIAAARETIRAHDPSPYVMGL